MFIKLGAKPEGKQSMLNVEEAYSLWDLATVKYAGIDMVQIWYIFAHDPDLKFILKRSLDKLKKQAKALEKELKKYSINGPDRPRSDINSATNSEILTDENLGKYLLLAMQEEMELLFKATRNATTNDALRALFIKFLTSVIDDLDSLIKYLKLKGWVGVPPIYPNIPVQTQEQADAGEIFHLWDHLTFRYDNIYQTQYWYEHAKDTDFKLLLKKGLQDNLKVQVERLENELSKFGVPLPSQPPAVIATTGSANLEDTYMYRILFTGMVGAAWMHALALKQCFTNDRLRGIFKDLLVDEINIIDKMILFGKVKGWLGVVPQFNPML
ncbi:MAG: hypothetical protein VR72_17005 [Clostridiaceae bacterium BRH_c20a]|nr:MAG: hypothetical protein VR72_17005 [Clostridiaceae bacterium BRH_c20a]